ncbi:MAG: hypothetical protein QNJ90_12135 [Planctomycetota bacterium]|nr:hypothetical protein [Planctomycetota bacterium]
MRSLLAVALLACFAGSAFAGSETPPEGPPWERDIVQAHGKALAKGVPLFVYFTKTY